MPASGFGVYGFLASGRVRAVRAQRERQPATADALQAAFVSVAERVRPAVVNIGTVQVARAGDHPRCPGPFTDDPFFKDFFDQFFGRGGPGRREEFRQPGLGSGVIIDKRGYVLTNYHVIRGADSVTVSCRQARSSRGASSATDPKTDLAVVKFEPDDELAVAKLGNSDTLRVGEWAIAIGNPVRARPDRDGRRRQRDRARRRRASRPTRTSSRPTRRSTRATRAGRS